MKAAMAAPAAAPATQRFRWDALQVALLVVLFLQVWRIQLLVRGLPLFGLPILATAAAAVLFALDRDRRRRLGRFDQPVVPGRLALAAATVFLITTLGETGSRGGFLGFVVVAGYLLLRFQGISRTKRVGAVALLVVLLMGLASDRYFERIETILHPTGDYNWSGKSETGRVEIWKRGVEYMLSHPALGVGAANFERAEGTLSPEARERQRYGRSFRWSTAHNSFIQIGAELGVFGVIFLVALVVDGFRMLGRIRRWPAGEAAVLAQVLTACLVGFVVTALFLSQAYSAYLYALLGMCLGLSRVVSAAAAGSPPPARPGVWGPGGAFPLAGGISSPSR